MQTGALKGSSNKRCSGFHERETGQAAEQHGRKHVASTVLEADVAFSVLFVHFALFKVNLNDGVLFFILKINFICQFLSRHTDTEMQR